jgi:hypothetical protein
MNKTTVQVTLYTAEGIAKLVMPAFSLPTKMLFQFIASMVLIENQQKRSAAEPFRLPRAMQSEAPLESGKR